MGRSLRVVIVDDERLARRQLARLLGDIPEVEVVDECADGAAAVIAIAHHAPDIAFVDIEMPNVDGLTSVRSTNSAVRPAIVFVTAHEQYTLEAFSLHAVDYLLKPVSPQRLASTVEYVRSRVMRDHKEIAASAAAFEPSRSSGTFLDRIAFRVDERLLIVPVSDVDRIEADDNYLNVYTARRRYRVRGRLGALEPQLDPRQFVRIHRSTIVALDRVVEVQPWFRGELIVVLRDGTKCKVGGSHRAALLSLISPEL